ncbi:tyrosine-type recombinase/integrase [Radiobacillus sp. PE A8.2]|uniref:tyrosine-type recombinase/integrase n=1 Tax=Radiobacillus sp. PE A8.2 TaxID=3380349 RepID=UPI00388E9C78
MEKYKHKIELFFELKNSPESTRETMRRRMNDFIIYVNAVLEIEMEETTFEDIQGYILHLKRDRDLSPGTINNYISSIKFFYTYVLEKTWNPIKVPRLIRAKNFPVIPPRGQVYALLNGTNNLKHKAILALIYGSGLRVSEVARLRIGDIDSQTMRVRVDGAKHNTNRNTILSEMSLLVLRKYFKAYHHRSFSKNDWLFTGNKKENPVTVKTIQNTFLKIRERLNLDTKISAHTLRHCFATHSLEDGVEPVHIQHMLGHKNVETTNGYLHTTSKSLMGIKSPLDQPRGNEL